MSDEKTDVTDRATAAGWTLPEGWRVLAWSAPDDANSDPREHGDCYKTDVDEADYDNPTRGFCKHCKGWIRKLDQSGADAYNLAHPPVRGETARLEAVTGDWSNSASGITCPATGAPDREPDETHELDEPLAVQWWREDRWTFVGVLVEVIDPDGRVWGQDSLWGTEAGTFPTEIDPDTGKVTSREIDPVTDKHHPVPELINQAMEEAREALARHASQGPEIHERRT